LDYIRISAANLSTLGSMMLHPFRAFKTQKRAEFYARVTTFFTSFNLREHDAPPIPRTIDPPKAGLGKSSAGAFI